MNAKAIFVAAALAVVGFVGVVSTASAASLACTVTDESNPHFFNAFGSVGVATAGGQTGGGLTVVFSANNAPCDQVGSDGDNEQGLAGAQMPISGATCPYSQDIANEQAGGGPVTVGHHGDDIFVTNEGNVDVTWSSGVDGQDPAATLAGQTCTGNGVISDDATTDPADCSDSTGANINILGSIQHDTDPLSVGTNDPSSGFTCFDSTDGNEWTFLNAGPAAPAVFSEGPIFHVSCTDGEGFVTVCADGDPNKACVDESDIPSDTDAAPFCAITVDTDWTPTGPSDASTPIGFSLPIAGTIASGVEI
jgi:hypothetical protein